MENQYLRKDQPRQTVGKWLKAVWKKKKLRLTVLIILPILSFMLFSNRGVIQRISLESQKKELVNKLEELKKEQQRLLELSRSLENDPKVIERVAREKYVMIREGETVYKVRPAN